MRLDRLPPRITGFFDQTEQARALDGAGFKKACHQVAQTDGGTVESVDLNLLGRSYFGATIRTRTDHLSVLCNSVYPYLAFVPPNAFGLGYPDLTFVEPTNLAFAHATDFQPLDANWLDAELSPELLTELAQSERGQLAYWKPKRIGDLVFNAWD